MWLIVTRELLPSRSLLMFSPDDKSRLIEDHGLGTGRNNVITVVMYIDYGISLRIGYLLRIAYILLGFPGFEICGTYSSYSLLTGTPTIVSGMLHSAHRCDVAEPRLIIRPLGAAPDWTFQSRVPLPCRFIGGVLKLQPQVVSDTTKLKPAGGL